MQLAEEACTRHPSRGRAVTHPVHAQHDLPHPLMSVKTGADAKERCFSPSRQSQHFRHGTIEDDLEPISIGYVEVPPGSAHAANTTRFQSLAILPWK
jgi:hypothetical protein